MRVETEVVSKVQRYGNHLTGPIPPELGRLRRLRTLSLRNSISTRGGLTWITDQVLSYSIRALDFRVQASSWVCFVKSVLPHLVVLQPVCPQATYCQAAAFGFAGNVQFKHVLLH